ncbi:precorrin-3B C(17)-methyltransferase [Holophaga foetida]|uniref:precorrin-3B C(17)-methyltransferase n=1 Tax=Holophaga foetida TaxID=35839 RepID=UPI0002471CED|nr:precorrin-3B C(17)-methyltransferase [Holophaga foetida]
MTGKLSVVGIGPGSILDRTRRAENAILEASVVAGYDLYLDHVKDLLDGKERIASGMMAEVERCRAALQAAQAGAKVALVSSGDAGIYGMAGLALEMAEAEGFSVPIEIVPGVSAAQSSAARMGAPLMLDWACISLSDLMVDWDTIRRRIAAVAEADMVLALYNPRSKRRIKQLEETVEILLKHRPGSTPVGIATAVGAPEERIVLSTLERLLSEDVGMRSLVIIGNKGSRVSSGWFITPRGYEL